MNDNTKDNKNKNTSAENVFRLSPPEIFETLLGEPEESGYDEEMLKNKYEKSADFACDSRGSRSWIPSEKISQPESKADSENNKMNRKK